MSNLVSVIIPVYNSDKYLEQCIKSVLLQSYEYIEIIIVNDGSTDNSLNICKNYASKYKNIKLIDQVNQGVSMARNIGVQHSSGDYLFFLDSDDIIHPQAISLMMNTLEDKNNIVICNFKKISEDSPIEYKEYEDSREVIAFTPEDYLKEILLLNKNTYAWGILASRDIVLMNPFPQGKYFEDLYTVYKYILAADKIIYLNNIFVFYRVSKLSIVSHMNNKKLLDYSDAIAKMTIDIVESYSSLKKYAVVIKCYGALQMFNYQECILDKNIVKQCVNYLNNNLKTCIEIKGYSSFSTKLFMWKYLRPIYNCLIGIKKRNEK